MNANKFENPYRPGAGHTPPYLAGREVETREFEKLVSQSVVLQNLVLTGLRGVGKTVLLERFKPIALKSGWLWVGTDLSESTSVSETAFATRVLADLAVATSSLIVHATERHGLGISSRPERVETRLDFQTLVMIYESTPGLASDKLKRVLETVWHYLRQSGHKGIVFAYDEAQNLADHADKDQYPLSLLLDVFQSIQRKEVPFMLALTGLPTLFPKLVAARTYAERMFHVVSLSALDREATEQAIREPLKSKPAPVTFTDNSVQIIAKMSAGYPYFIQYICREVFDIWVSNMESGQPPAEIPVEALTAKLDADFFSGRWARATDRQRDLLTVISVLESAATEFTVQEVVQQAKLDLQKPFSPSQVGQMLQSLTEAGLVYKNRWGKYSLAVPLLDGFIRRQANRSSA